jgi:hypothetical protein
MDLKSQKKNQQMPSTMIVGSHVLLRIKLPCKCYETDPRSSYVTATCCSLWFTIN